LGDRYLLLLDEVNNIVDDMCARFSNMTGKSSDIIVRCFRAMDL